MKQKVLVILPVLPQISYTDEIVQSLHFLNNDCELAVIDPLTWINNRHVNENLQTCRTQLKAAVSDYDAFLGFSLGGVILQQHMDLFENQNKPLILFSTPAFADDVLTEKLTEVIRLCDALQVDEALRFLYQFVYHPKPYARTSFNLLNQEASAQRVSRGLRWVLDADNREILQTTTVSQVHLSGASSGLVMPHHLMTGNRGQLFSVPGAGMRVLEDNPLFCQRIVMDALGIY